MDMDTCLKAVFDAINMCTYNELCSNSWIELTSREKRDNTEMEEEIEIFD